jgi:hypothetical protein
VTKWKAAWIISETLRRKDYAAPSFDDFARRADEWDNRDKLIKVGIPHPWERDGIEAELALRRAGVIA